MCWRFDVLRWNDIAKKKFLRYSDLHFRVKKHLNNSFNVKHTAIKWIWSSEKKGNANSLSHFIFLSDYRWCFAHLSQVCLVFNIAHALTSLKKQNWFHLPNSNCFPQKIMLKFAHFCAPKTPPTILFPFRRETRLCGIRLLAGRSFYISFRVFLLSSFF